MKKNFIKKNIFRLTKKDPGLAEAVKCVRPKKGYIVTPSQLGPPSLSLTFPDGKRKTIHSSYDPIREAVRFVNTCNIDGFTNFMVFGLGLGYHIQELIKKVPRTSRIIIFEKEIEVLYFCLANTDFTQVLSHPGVSFQVGIDTSSMEKVLKPDLTRIVLKGCSIIKIKSLMNLEIDYYSKLLQKIESIINETHIDWKSQVALSKNFYQNIFDNWKNILNSHGIKSIKDKFLGTPVIIVSAGPSLDKNISFLKNSNKRSLVIAVATALKPLIQNGIHVDFVVAVDSGESTIQFFNIENIPKNIWLIFDPCVPSSVLEKFPNRRIKIDSGVCLSHWISSKQGDNKILGKTSSVAHTAFLFSSYLGCSPIILVGQDLSFNQYRLHCSDTHYDQIRKDKIDSMMTLKQLEQERYYEMVPSFKFARDIFRKTSITTLVLNLYKETFAEHVKKGGFILNATEGGIAIPGVMNITLLEALNQYCPESHRSRICALADELDKPNHVRNINSELKKQSKRFYKVVKELQKMKSRYLKKSHLTKRLKMGFVRKMDEFYKVLLNQSDILKLLQGYSYLTFIEWNQQNEKIILKEEKGLIAEVLEDKYQRDKKFLEVMEGSAETLKKAFNKMASEIN